MKNLREIFEDLETSYALSEGLALNADEVILIVEYVREVSEALSQFMEK